MKRIRSILSAHKMLTLCVAVLMFVSLTFASISIAKSKPPAAIEAEPAVVKQDGKNNCGWYKRRAYFSDATHSTQVGSRRWFCDGEVGSAGTITVYFEEYTCECFEDPL